MYCYEVNGKLYEQCGEFKQEQFIIMHLSTEDSNYHRYWKGDPGQNVPHFLTCNNHYFVFPPWGKFEEVYCSSMHLTSNICREYENYAINNQISSMFSWLIVPYVSIS